MSRPEPGLPEHYPLAALEQVQAGPLARVQPGMLVEHRRGFDEDKLPPALTETVTPLALLKCFQRRWKIALPTGILLGLIGAVTIWFALPDKYTAYALLRVNTSKERIFEDLNHPGTPEAVDRGTSQYQRTQAALMTSRPVIRNVLKQDKIRKLAIIRAQDEPDQFLDREIKSELVENTNVLKVSLTSRYYPEELHTIVNAVQEAYFAEIAKGEHSAQLSLLEDMEKIYGTWQEKMRVQREQLRRLADIVRTGDLQTLSQKQKNMLEEYAALRRELFGVEAKLRDAQVQRASYQARLRLGQQTPSAPAPSSGSESKSSESKSSGEEVAKEAPKEKAAVEAKASADTKTPKESVVAKDTQKPAPKLDPKGASKETPVAKTAAPEERKQISAKGPDKSAEAKASEDYVAVSEREIENDLVVQKQLMEVTKLQEKIDQQRELAQNPNGTFLQAMELQLKAANTTLDRLRAEKRKALVLRSLDAMRGEVALKTIELDAAISVHEQQRESIAAQIATLSREVDKLGVGSIDIELKRAEIEQAEYVLKSLRAQKERLQMELSSSAARRVVLLSPADEATIPSKRARLMQTLAAGFAGLLFGLLGVSLFEYRARKIYTSDEVSRGLRLRVVGTVPAMPLLKQQKKADAVALTYWNQLLTESVDSVRTMLLEEPAQDTSRILMVASARSGEGKSTLAGHLASSLARAGRRTLLIDGDLRNPTLHRAFGLPRAPGVCELISKAATLDETIRATPDDRLFFLSAGTYSQLANTALAQGGLRPILDSLRERYDFVIVDSSPVLSVPDALIIGKLVDGLVFSIRPGLSSVTEVHAAHERLRELRIPFLGTVVNGVRDRNSYANAREYLTRVNV